MEPEPTPPPETPPPPPPEAPPPPPEAAPAIEPAATTEGPPEAPAEGEPAPVVEKPKREPKKPKKRPSYEMKLFEKYDLNEVVVHDAGLAKYMNLSPIVIPHTGGRYANKPFGKAKSYRVVRTAFEIIARKTGKNPVQILVDALEKAAPREEITRLRFGGISVPRAVDVAPSRRLDLALRSITTGAVSATFKNRKPVEECLADEILMAAKGDMQSSAIAKKEELERVASSAR